MAVPTTSKSARRVNSRARFSEAGAWARMRDGWQRLHGSFAEQGFSIEWHDFTTGEPLDWSSTFHPGGVEICLNVTGRATVQTTEDRLQLEPQTAGFYFHGTPGLKATRVAKERHQFATVELSVEFLRQHLIGEQFETHPALQAILAGKAASWVSHVIRLGEEHRSLVESLRKPPVYASAQRLWYHAKALEVAAALFYQPPAGDDLFCQRQKRLNHDRALKVIALLKEDLAETLPLEEIGRRVGCSPFHLSRIFSQEVGRSIFQHLRKMRMERAAELLREGRLNVTQVALEVGYSSPSHFSAAFHEAHGCCPGLFPLSTPAQRTTLSL